MRTLWLVIKHDVTTTLAERSFWILALLMPLILMGTNAYSIMQGSALETDERNVGAEQAEVPTIALVDEGGLVKTMPPNFPEGLFVPYEDEASARAALEAGEVEQVAIIPADYIASGQVLVYDQDFRAMGGNTGVGLEGQNASALEYIIAYNLTGNDNLARALLNPTPGDVAEQHVLQPANTRDAAAQVQAMVVSSIVPYAFYFLLIMGSSYLMRSVVGEKENRTAEVLLVSIEPRTLMLGKVLAMSVVLTIQLAIWAAGAVLILDLGAAFMQQASSFTFPPGFIAWAAVFLVAGYLLFAAIMAAGGAIAANAREASPLTFLVILPLMPTLMFGYRFAEDPHSPLVVALSLFPFSAPSAMVTRLAVSPVPLWQILLSLGLLVATAYGCLALAARFFRAGNLLSDTAFSFKRLATGWRQ
ncbi:MAG: ABC transporter permease [Anaerolineales bacterium]|nr:ABC transporter permease [Anaerolineales bacterium]